MAGDDEDQTWYDDFTYLDDRSTPTGLVYSYFNAIHRKEYLRAYSYWRTPAASLGAYENFAAGFKYTGYVTVRLGEISQGVALGQIYYSVPVLIKALTTTGERQRFIACYVVQLSQPSSQGVPPFVPMGIARAKSKVVETPGSGGALLASACSGVDDVGAPVKPSPVTDPDDISVKNYLDDRSDPTQVVRSLANAINRKEYTRAYAYWEHVSGMANVPPYDQFVKGYASTERVNLTVGMVISKVSAGHFYYSVPVLWTTQTTPAAIHTYVGCYLLHLSNPARQNTPPYQPLAIQSAKVWELPVGADPNSMLRTACNP